MASVQPIKGGNYWIKGKDGKDCEFNCPYDLMTYWTYTERARRRRHPDPLFLEAMILQITYGMEWCEKFIKPENESTFDHDYYEMVEDRQKLLNVLKRRNPEEYDIFTRFNEVERYEKRKKQIKMEHGTITSD